MSIDAELSAGEEILERRKRSRWNFFWWYLIGIPLVFLWIGLIPIVIAEIKRYPYTFYLTNKRVIKEYRFFSRRVTDTRYEYIQDIHTTQSLVGRIMNIGTLRINTAGSAGVELVLPGVPRPVELKNQINNQRG